MARKNKFLLTIVCNSTKWLHAVPLTNLRARTIADKLIEFFSFTGIPKVIRMDNMAAFQSELFTALRERLVIDARFSEPYHFESHGGVERANRTVGDILRKLLETHPKTWDQLSPYILFALCEVKNKTTNYSPAELVFGRRIRGLLAIARDNWAKGDPNKKQLKIPTVTYLERLNESIETALAAARENVKTAQTKRKDRYDKTSSIRELKPQDLALVLLPTEGGKLYAKWRGPYTVIRRCENDNYEINIDGRRAILHMKCLRKYHQRADGGSDNEADDGTQTVGIHMVISEEQDGEPWAWGKV